MKRIVVAADFHCGNRVGLTPPAWQDSPETGPVDNKKYATFQREVWKHYADTLSSLQPIDYYFFLGDAVDGKGERSGGTEETVNDRIKQSDMATACIKQAEAREVFMVYGTPYHTGVNEDWEDIVARNVGASIGGQEFVEVEGVTFMLKHFIGGSQIPHGRYTAMARDALWNLVWGRDERQPKADVFLRGHVHYYIMLGDEYVKGFICPALQGYGSKYGIRRCSGTVSIGLLSFTVDGGHVGWNEHIIKGDLLRVEPRRPL
jgi:hypothetical protein